MVIFQITTMTMIVSIDLLVAHSNCFGSEYRKKSIELCNVHPMCKIRVWSDDRID